MKFHCGCYLGFQAPVCFLPCTPSCNRRRNAPLSHPPPAPTLSQETVKRWVEMDILRFIYGAAATAVSMRFRHADLAWGSRTGQPF